MGSIDPPTIRRRQIRDDDTGNLTSLFEGTSTKIILPEHTDDYNAAIARWSMAAAKPAGVVIQPSNSQEVAIAVKYANANNIELAVKGGGHSTSGASSTDGGILLSLESLRKVTIEDWPAEPGQKVLRVGGGATWADVDNEGVRNANPLPLHTVGGTVADTGVGGLTLGGGYGWLSGKHGLTIDCLLEVEVVLANGDIVRASETHNQDLFWAMSGAGQNFGVATEFILRAYPQGDIWIGLVMFPVLPEIVEKVVNVINDVYTPDSNGHTKFAGKAMGGLGFLSPPPAEGKILLLVSVIWHGSEEEGREAWKPLFDIGPIISTMQMLPFAAANKMLAPPAGLRSSMKGSAFQLPLSTSFVTDVHDIFAEFYTADRDDRGASLMLYELYDPHATISSNKGCFANRGTHMNALICPIWKDAANDAACRQWARDLNERFKKELERKNIETSEGGAGGVAPRGEKGAVLLYGNYDQYDEKSRDIFGEHYPKLQALKARYDPENLFSKLFPIQPDNAAAAA